MKNIIYSKEIEQECIDLINKDPNNIKYIINSSEELKKLAVKNGGHAIYHIKNPSEELQKLAVQQNGFSIYFIKKPSEEIKKLAILNSNFDYFIIKYYCTNISKQWLEEQQLIKDILK